MDEDSSLYLTFEEAHERAQSLGAKCRECPLYGQRQGPVLGQIKPNSDLIVIGEYPSKFDIRKRKIFRGDLGKKLDESLVSGGMSRDDISLTNVILCKHPTVKESLDDWLRKQRRIKGLTYKSPFECCRPRFENDLKKSNSKTVVTLGKHALAETAKYYEIPYGSSKKQYSGEKRLASLKQQRGHPLPLDDGTVICPTFHFERTSKYMLHVIRRDIIKACKISQRGGKLNWKKVPYLIEPSFEEAIIWMNKAQKSSTILMVDIETDGVDADCDIRCIGMGYGKYEDEQIMVLPLVYKNGQQYWQKDERALIEDALRQLLSSSSLAFQYGQFDTTHLLRFNYLTNPRQLWDDTILLHKNSFECNSQHDLNYLSSRITGDVVLWKGDVDHKAIENYERDRDLWIYCGDDILAQMRCLHEFKIWQETDETYLTYEIDKRLAPVVRDMSLHGMVVDDQLRQKISDKLSKKIDSKREILCQIVGREFNPNSTRQVAKFLFDERGLKPILNTKGKPFSEYDTPSTNEDSLILLGDELIKHGVEEDVIKFLDQLLILRGLQKLKSTYVDIESKLVDVDDMKVIYSTFNLHVVPTGRLSSTGYNLQNIPKRGIVNVREMFIPPKGHYFVSADFEQLESRLYALAAKDQSMLKAFREGLDMHCLNAAIMEVDEEKDLMAVYEKFMTWKGLKKKKSPTDEEKKLIRKIEYVRLCAKVFGFSKQYGAEWQKIYDSMRCERDENQVRLFPKLNQKTVRVWNERWAKFHPETSRWQQDVIQFLNLHGYTEEPYHYRKRFFPGGPDSPHAPYNHVIQGWAAALTNQAMLRIDKVFPPNGWEGLTCQVHDEIILTVKKSRALEMAKKLEEAMDYEFNGIRVYAESEISDRWTGKDLTDEFK